MRFADLRIVKANRGERRIGGPETEGEGGTEWGVRSIITIPKVGIFIHVARFYLQKSGLTHLA